MKTDVGADGFDKGRNAQKRICHCCDRYGTETFRQQSMKRLKTGDIEVIATDIRVLSESQTPPFPIEENSQTKDEIRLKYRYLDLRRPDLQRNLMMRSKVAYLMFVISWQKRDSWRSRHRILIKIHTGGSKRLSGTEPCASGYFLCAAAVSAAV